MRRTVVPPHKTPSWMLSFADLLALLLTFFVLIFSMNRVTSGDWRLLIEGLRAELKAPLSSDARPIVDSDDPADPAFTLQRQTAVDLDYLQYLIEEDFPKGSPIRLTRLADRLVISIRGDRLFEPGLTILSANGQSILLRLANRIRFLSNRVEVAAHAGRLATVNETYPSAWELTVDQAAEVAHALVRLGYSGKPAIQGYADSRKNWLSTALDEEQQSLWARRVDIMVRHYRREEVDVFAF